MKLIETLVTSVREQGLLSEAYSLAQLEEPDADCIPENLPQHYKAIVDASVKSPAFRQKVFQPAYPAEVGKIGYMSDVDSRYAIGSGFHSAAMIADYMDKHCDLAKNSSILDFGCGTLRICRYLIQFLKNFNYAACDVNPFSIRWARSEFGNRAKIFLMANKPPLPLEAAGMDFIFAWSIFSHYSENAHETWLKELHRILRPGGYLFITLQSEHLLNRLRNEKEMRGRYRAEKADLEDLSKSYLHRGFGFYKCYQQTNDDFGFDVDNFGMAFISPAYISRAWTKDFEVLCIDVGVVGNVQDIVLLRKV